MVELSKLKPFQTFVSEDDQRSDDGDEGEERMEEKKKMKAEGKRFRECYSLCGRKRKSTQKAGYGGE